VLTSGACRLSFCVLLNSFFVWDLQKFAANGLGISKELADKLSEQDGLRNEIKRALKSLGETEFRISKQIESPKDPVSVRLAFFSLAPRETNENLNFLLAGSSGCRGGIPKIRPRSESQTAYS